MRISGNYGTHMGLLIAALNKTSGDVLELGMGFFSTPYLHYQCLLSKRKLVSIDNDKGFVKMYASSNYMRYNYENPYHQFVYVKNWADADIERPWDVVLVDHSPSERRIEEVKRLAKYAKLIIIHDSNSKFERDYHYSEIYPLFKYSFVWDKDNRHATVLSNFINLERFI